MLALFRFPLLASALLGAGLLLGSPVARAQTAAPAGAVATRGYDFLTVTVIKAPYRTECRLLLTPAFQGKSEVTLEEEYTLTRDKYREALQRNTLLLNQTLSDLTVAGWELTETHAAQEGPPPSATVTRYLFRKAKN
jgi:hypothetical protein